ncbi:MAG: AraC family transcriptional regulator [Pseudomonadota bacterium]
MTRLPNRPLATLERHARDNTLLIPEDLHGFSDARPIMSHGAAGVFHKIIRQDMEGVEFFTNAPCLAYVQRGRETFYDADGHETVVGPGDMLFLPGQQHMVSDFRNADGPLEAWLFFFDAAVIADFLRVAAPSTVAGQGKVALFAGSARLEAFVAALPQVYGGMNAPAALVRAKLLELLMLLHLHHRAQQLYGFLVDQTQHAGRRNIRQIMRAHALEDLSVADYAKLSGRSLSAFQRDFKRAYGIPPSVWLRQARLEHAHGLVTGSSTPISEIAHAAGFADTSHFIKLFKAFFDATPKQLRQDLSR